MNFEMAFSIFRLASRRQAFRSELLCYSRLAETQEKAHAHVVATALPTGAAVRHQCSVPFDCCSLRRCRGVSDQRHATPFFAAMGERQGLSRSGWNRFAVPAPLLRSNFGATATVTPPARGRVPAPAGNRAARDLGDHSSLPRSDAAYSDSVNPERRRKCRLTELQTPE